MKSKLLTIAAVSMMVFAHSAFATGKVRPQQTPREQVNDIHISSAEPEATPAAEPDTTPHNQRMTAGVEAKSKKNGKVSNQAQSERKAPVH